MALRRIFRPFLKTVHPDVLQNSGKNVKRTNEVSLQNLNTILDGFQSSADPNTLKFGSRSLTNDLPKIDQIYELTFHYRNENDSIEGVEKNEGTYQGRREDSLGIKSKKINRNLEDVMIDSKIEKCEKKEELSTFRTKLMFSSSSLSRFVKNIQENQSKSNRSTRNNSNHKTLKVKNDSNSEHQEQV